MCESVKMLIGRGKRIRKKIKNAKNVKKLRKNVEGTGTASRLTSKYRRSRAFLHSFAGVTPPSI